ncbi:MAG TPA: hypothetical protein PLI65_00350 [Bacteroidales bacterium]|nr:hypothetical protein [Bacteroidales bacterium]HPR56740.1 hypothetical protein [Bacteroidales bacterium]HRW96576.1 hypothetical protein [Bacteroidales bacterium]
MKKIIYFLVLLIALGIGAHVFFLNRTSFTDFQLGVVALVVIFLLIFGSYGLYAENLFKRLKEKGKTDNLCIEASYRVQQKGLIGKILLFPFMKIKSSNSVVISFFGALAWVIILMIVFQALKKG